MFLNNRYKLILTINNTCNSSGFWCFHFAKEIMREKQISSHKQIRFNCRHQRMRDEPRHLYGGADLREHDGVVQLPTKHELRHRLHPRSTVTTMSRYDDNKLFAAIFVFRINFRSIVRAWPRSINSLQLWLAWNKKNMKARFHAEWNNNAADESMKFLSDHFNFIFELHAGKQMMMHNIHDCVKITPVISESGIILYTLYLIIRRYRLFVPDF